MSIQSLCQVWQRKFSKTDDPLPLSIFVDLGPTENVANAEIYFKAINFAINNDRVFNIALTGPYGSGKSSVIKSFLAQYPQKVLNLSLASFFPDGGKPTAIDTQEIERSILKQILYGVEADKLPFSRFSRIRRPKPSSIATSLLITVGLACAGYLISKAPDVLSGEFFDPLALSNWFNYLCAGVVSLSAWKVIHSVYTTSFGFALKSISLKDFQIATAAVTEESILNRHLDEILYFFQSTDYDLVVIEDLDRFEDPDIFVTLREINGLINANEGIKRQVRFLYALRDDIFANNDRTKFFEFIVPIVPVINHSNSIDKILEQGQRIDLESRLNRQFVREVSRYLADLRLIRNIFNEYVVYAANLRADNEGALDPNKLLAVLIYKNVIPKDFAALHRQEGALSQVLGRYDQYVSKIEGEIQAEISGIETDLEVGAAQTLRNESDLRKVYAMAIVARIPAGYHVLHTTIGDINLGDLPESDALEPIIAQKSISISGNRLPQKTIHFSDLEELVDPNRSFAQRKAALGQKTAKFRQSSEKRIRELKARLASLRNRRFNEVVRESADLIDEIFAEAGENREILKYLILEGHLDDTYYQYISLFHQGRLSPNDNNFLIRIRAYDNPRPDFPIDNTAEVIASMRDEDFGHHYVLNRFIVDHLLEHSAEHARRIADAADFISTHFRDCGEFFRIYYAKGAQIQTLIKVLSERWQDFTSVALDGADGASHAAQILAYTPDGTLKNAHALKSFLSVKTPEVLAEGVDFDIGRLGALAVEIDDLERLADFPGALSFVAKEGLYRISIDNIGCILRRVVGLQKIENLEKRHFSTIKEANDSDLLERIRADFPAYVRDVLLMLEANTDEEVTAILEVLAHQDVDHDMRVEFLRRQTVIFPNFDDIPAAFHQIALVGQQIEFSWENCLAFMNSEEYDSDLLTTYLQDSKTVAALSRKSIPGDEAFVDLRRFIAANDALDLQIYQSYVQRLPRQFGYVPEVGAGKIKILIEEHKISFSPKTFGSLPNDELQLLFIAAHFPAYDAKKGDYSIDDEFRAKLLQTEITGAQKLNLIHDMDESFVVGSPSVAADIGPILGSSSIETIDFGVDFLKAVILSTRPIEVQITLFNKVNRALTVSDVREVLRGLPKPYQDIRTFGKSPKIVGSDVNRQLAFWLKQRNIISSFGDTFLSGEIKIHTFKKAR